MKKLPKEFYLQTNVLTVAKELLGKILVTKWEGDETSGRIVEVEAYKGTTDKASHAYGGKRTLRNKVMYAGGGVAYIYLCYGIHHLVNVVTNLQDTPHAILIRAAEPVKGTETMLIRTGKKKSDYTLTRGPGNLSKALGLHIDKSGWSLRSKEFFIADDGLTYSKKEIASSPRIGVDYAEEDALLPYRFYVKGSPFVSRGKVK
ncbi:MAG: DNA-3-methyladenine glycosylase [Bacteroidota bacterium]